jgi:hypothetical protein
LADGPAFARGSSLHRRLTITYTAALAAGLLIFAFLSLATIDRTLENTRADAGSLKPRPIDLAVLAARAAARLAPFAASRSVHITGAIDAPPAVTGDPDILERVSSRCCTTASNSRPRGARSRSAWSSRRAACR